MDPDVLLDRRRLRRRLTFWRVVAFLALALALLSVIGYFSGGRSLLALHRPQIARIEISGVMLPDRELLELLDKVGSTKAVKAVIIAIDSPGGTTAAGEAAYTAIRKLGEKKPVVATIEALGASAGYMTAIAAERIFARRAALTGSIGVLFQFAQVGELMKAIGINVEIRRSGRLKAQPSPFEPASEEARAVIDDIIADSYDWFVDIVAQRRGLSRAGIRAAEGRVFTGAQALEFGLVDAIGGEAEAVAWLAAERGIEAGLPVRTWAPKAALGDDLSPIGLALAWIAARTGLGQHAELSTKLAETILGERLLLDGLVSVWHASPSRSGNDGKGVFQ